jgi:hypothetical protein
MFKFLKARKQKKKIEEIHKQLAEKGEYAILLGTNEDNHIFADAIVGISENPTQVMYDSEKVIEAFMQQNKWSYDEAFEWFEFNTVRAVEYLSDKNKPVLVYNA